MAKEYGRNRRVADQVQRELAVMIQREMSDAGHGMITISAADVSPDLKNARIYFTTLSADDTRTDTATALNEMAGHFRHLLATSLPLRVVPRLEFVYDESQERGRRLSALIDSVNKGPQGED